MEIMLIVVLVVFVLFLALCVKLFSPRKSPYSIGNAPKKHDKGGRQYR